MEAWPIRTLVFQVTIGITYRIACIATWIATSVRKSLKQAVQLASKAKRGRGGNATLSYRHVLNHPSVSIHPLHRHI